MKVGDDVVVIGTGSIGMYCLMVAKAAGAGRLIAVDVSDFALATAQRLGATHIINPNHSPAVESIAEILPKGPDLVVEAAGPIEAGMSHGSLVEARHSLECFWNHDSRNL